MIHVIPARERYFSDFGWLKTYWLFSFSDYYAPDNIQFGALRVFNDDVVEPGTGFPTHPHREMEIVTVVLAGEMTHEDSMGNRTVIRRGDVQRMSAGTGLTHSEFNLASRPVHFCQIWIYPDRSGLEPTYDQKHYKPSDWRGRLLPVASSQGLSGTVSIHADATIYRSSLAPGMSLDFGAGENRRVFVYSLEGAFEINGTKLLGNDQARIDLESRLCIKAAKQSEFILIDVPSCRGWGYDQKTLKGKRTGGSR